MTTEPDAAAVDAADLAALAHSEAARGLVWTHQGADLNANLLLFAAGDGVAEHVNAEVDVLLVGVAGDGVVEVDGRSHALGAGRLLVVPKGARRATRAVGDRFAYLTCHRRRPGLWPTGLVRPDPPSAAGGAEPTP
jgi:quercetin dioxygenase-like cupin family protein